MYDVVLSKWDGTEMANHVVLVDGDGGSSCSEVNESSSAAFLCVGEYVVCQFISIGAIASDFYISVVETTDYVVFQSPICCDTYLLCWFRRLLQDPLLCLSR